LTKPIRTPPKKGWAPRWWPPGSGIGSSIANIGDSRAYALKKIRSAIDRRPDLRHFLVETGKITPEQALTHPERHVLMNALGIYPSVSLTISVYPYHGESFLLCSDGLYNQVPEKISSPRFDRRKGRSESHELICEANNNGGSDNEGVAYWESMAMIEIGEKIDERYRVPPASPMGAWPMSMKLTIS
jgi:hypothetical protein